jgi:hypothetical protein
MLETFLKTYKRPLPLPPEHDPWLAQTQQRRIQAEFMKAARLYDGGKVSEARSAIDRILGEKPDEPFAIMLRSVMNRGV